MLSLSEKYPTGRKNCSSCKRWRHLTDFRVENWKDSEKTIPKLRSYCHFCAKQMWLSYKRKHRKQRLDAKLFASYIEQFMVRRGRGRTTFIRGRRLTKAHDRAFRRWRSGEIKTVGIQKADEFAVSYDLPLWEIDREVGRIAA
jgi:hypothetical protein